MVFCSERKYLIAFTVNDIQYSKTGWNIDTPNGIYRFCIANWLYTMVRFDECTFKFYFQLLYFLKVIEFCWPIFKTVLFHITFFFSNRLRWDVFVPRKNGENNYFLFLHTIQDCIVVRDTWTYSFKSYQFDNDSIGYDGENILSTYISCHPWLMSGTGWSTSADIGFNRFLLKC